MQFRRGGESNSNHVSTECQMLLLLLQVTTAVANTTTTAAAGDRPTDG